MLSVGSCDAILLKLLTASFRILTVVSFYVFFCGGTGICSEFGTVAMSEFGPSCELGELGILWNDDADGSIAISGLHESRDSTKGYSFVNHVPYPFSSIKFFKPVAVFEAWQLFCRY